MSLAVLLLSNMFLCCGVKEKVWIYFTPKENVICETDTVACHLLPPDESKVRQLEVFGAEVIHTSNWLNAVSVLISQDQLPRLRNAAFVEDLQPVLKLSSAVAIREPFFPTAEEAILRTPARFITDAALTQNYGQSSAQLLFHRIDKVHQLGYDGSDVIVGIMDGGFDVSHEVFKHLRDTKRILAERDFVDGGSDTKVNVKDASYHSHGTSVAAIIAGSNEGVLMGVSPGVSLVLARTEDDEQEAPVEEDHWVAAIEWMQTLGVHVVNSSLGYNLFTSQPSASYSYSDMNGRTSAIARAASKAARVFNMVVVVSAGNEGANSWKYITTPADADSILAVGSLDAGGIKARSSSIGPTSDGRIKPDVSARGECVFSANSLQSRYSTCLNGTSFAAPHVAGMMALALQARPGMPAIWYVRQAQKASSLFLNPNNQIGYGNLDASNLISNVTTSLDEGDSALLPKDAFLAHNYPNPFNPATTIEYQLPDGWSLVEATVIDILGRAILRFDIGSSERSGTVSWDGRNQSGRQVSSGVYYVRFVITDGNSVEVVHHPMSLIK